MLAHDPRISSYRTQRVIQLHPTFRNEIAQLSQLSTLILNPDCINLFIWCLKEESSAISTESDDSLSIQLCSHVKATFFEGYNAGDLGIHNARWDSIKLERCSSKPPPQLTPPTPRNADLSLFPIAAQSRMLSSNVSKFTDILSISCFSWYVCF